MMGWFDKRAIRGLGCLAVLLALGGMAQGDDRQEIVAARKKARDLSDERRYAEAEKYYLRALELAPRAFGPQHPFIADILSSLAIVYVNQGAYARAESLFQRGLRIKEKAYGLDHPEVAVTLTNLGNLYCDQGRYADAEPLFQRSLRILEMVHGPDHPDVAGTLLGLANAYVNQGSCNKAEPLYQRCLRIDEKTHGPDHPYVAQALNNLAELYRAQGSYTKAEPFYRRSLRIKEKALGSDHPDVAFVLNNLAVLFKNQGLFGQAEALYRRSLTISEKALGPEHPDVAACLCNLAELSRGRRAYSQAERLYQRSLRIREKALGPDHPRLAASLVGLALLYTDQQAYAQAEPLYQRSLGIMEKRLGTEHPDLAFYLNGLALLYQARGAYDKAEPLLQRSLRLREKALGPDHPDVGDALNRLATLYQAQGAYGQAEPLFRRGLRIGEKALGPDHPKVANSLNGLALLAAAQEQWDQAGDLFDRQRRRIRRFVNRELCALPQAEQLDFLGGHQQARFHAALTLAWRCRDDSSLVERSAAWLLNGKAVAYQALASRALLERATSDPALRDAVRQLQDLRRRHASLALAPARPGQDDRRRDQLKRLAEEQQRLESRLGQAAGVAATSADPWVELGDVRKAMPADGVLVELARFVPWDFARDRKAQPARYAAWVVPAAGGGNVRLLDLGEAAAIDQAVQAARQALADAPKRIRQQGEPDAEAALRESLETLAKLVLHPLLPHVGKSPRWFLSPDGSLWLVPWGALPLPDGKYAIEEHPISYMVSGRDLVNRPAEAQVNTTAPLVLADPDFDLGLDRVALQTRRLLSSQKPAETRGLSEALGLGYVPRLPGTAAEAEAINPRLQEYTGQKPRLYTDQEALAGVFQAARSPRVVLLSTHGFFLPDQEAGPADGIRGPGPGDQPQALPLENPLLRCGLLLAGCNNAAKARDGEDNGVLTGLQIVGTDLRGCELVVLSACETGLGDVHNGEGVAGLRQAFQLAGAESVVATLWQVPDQQSAQLMIRFFDNLAARQSKADALRNAQLALIKARREKNGAAHPFFWAAFTLTGQEEPAPKAGR